MRYVELCCGAAAVGGKLLWGSAWNPPVSWLGGKRRFASAILGCFGLHPGAGADESLWVDAGPWGWVWPVLLDSAGAAAVATVLRGWSTEDPEALWGRLSKEPPPKDRGSPEAIAQWLWLQARSVNSIPVFWGPNLDRWEMGAGSSQGPNSRSQKAQQTVGRDGRPHGVQSPTTVAARLGSWRSETRPDRPSRTEPCRPGRIQPGVGGHGVDILHADVRTIQPGPDESETFVYFDPPYEGRTGYGWGLPQSDVVAVAQRWASAGAFVVVSEGVRLHIPGWHHLEVTHVAKGIVKGQEWLTCSRPPVRVPAKQQALFGGAA